MDKLIEIAKECGADFSMVLLPSGNTRYVEFDEQQLHATIEQVCRPLVDKLTELEKWAHLWTDETNGLLVECRKQIAAYTEIMGDKK